MRKEKCARNDVFNNVLTVIKVIYQKKKKIKLTNELIANDLYCSQSSLCEYRKNTRNVSYEFIDQMVWHYTKLHFDAKDETETLLKNEYFRILDLFLQTKTNIAYQEAKHILTNYQYLFSNGINYYLMLYALVKIYENDEQFLQVSDKYYLEELQLYNEQRLFYQSLMAININMIHNTLKSNPYVLVPKDELLHCNRDENIAILALYQLLINQTNCLNEESNIALVPSHIFYDLGYINFSFLAQCNELYIASVQLQFAKIYHYLIKLARFKNQSTYEVGKNCYFWLVAFVRLIYQKQFTLQLALPKEIEVLFDVKEYHEFLDNSLHNFRNYTLAQQNEIVLNYILGVDNYRRYKLRLCDLTVDEVLTDPGLKNGCKVLLLRLMYDLHPDDAIVSEDIKTTVKRLLCLSLTQLD